MNIDQALKPDTLAEELPGLPKPFNVGDWVRVKSPEYLSADYHGKEGSIEAINAHSGNCEVRFPAGQFGSTPIVSWFDPEELEHVN